VCRSKTGVLVRVGMVVRIQAVYTARAYLYACTSLVCASRRGVLAGMGMVVRIKAGCDRRCGNGGAHQGGVCSPVWEWWCASRRGVLVRVGMVVVVHGVCSVGYAEHNTCFAMATSACESGLE